MHELTHAPRSGPLRELARGAGAFFGGIGYLAKTPRLVGWALLPASVAVLAGLVLAVAGVWGVVHVAGNLIAGGGGLAWIGRTLFEVLFGGVAVVGAVLVAIAVAQPLTRAALDRIAAPLEGGALRASSGLLASIAVALSALGVTLPTVGLLELVTLFAPEAAPLTEPIAFAASALGLAWEIFDHPFSRHGLGVRERLGWIKAHFFTVLGFAAAAQAFLLVPGVDVFLLPVGIAGATKLFATSPREARPRIPASSSGG